MRKRRGMVLSLEAIFYLAVVLILIGCGATYWHSHTENARASTAKADCVTIAEAVAQYDYEVQAMPTSLDKLTKKGGSGNELGPWLNEVKKDPWGRAYKLYVDRTNKIFVVYSDVNGKASGTPKTTEAGLKSGGFVGVIQKFEYK